MKPLIIFMLCLVGYVNAGTIDPATSDIKYTEYGKKFISVYRMCGFYKDGSLFCASAVVIKPRCVLTAAHVVENAKDCFVSKDDEKIKINKIIMHEDFDRDNFGFGDLAICYTEKPIIIDEYPTLYELLDEKDKLCSIAGYGLTGTFETGSIKSDLKIRAGTNKIDYIHKELLICTASRRNDTDTTGLEFLISSGDSGGGLFIDGKLAGINSSVLALDRKTDSSYGDESAHSRISSYAGWIKEKMKLLDNK